MESSQPEDSAESLLRGYRYQDLRMEHLLGGEYTKAWYDERKAIEEMAKAYDFEFPDATESAAAGEHFMIASFMQDEIENWLKLRNLNVPSCCLNIPYLDTINNIQQDPRWQYVATELQTMCELAGINTAYIEPKIEFLKLHGVGDPAYKEFARQAERTKIMAMGDISETRAEELTRFFLRGVQQHDEWNEYESVDESLSQVVSEFYRQVQCERSYNGMELPG